MVVLWLIPVYAKHQMACGTLAKGIMVVDFAFFASNDK
jgi:hypothetical protein